MPTPKKGERKKKFIKRCIPDLFKEEGTLTSKDKKSKQAYAICNSTFDRRKKKKNENILYFDEFVNEDIKDILPFEEDDWSDVDINRHKLDNPYKDGTKYVFIKYHRDEGYDFFVAESINKDYNILYDGQKDRLSYLEDTVGEIIYDENLIRNILNNRIAIRYFRELVEGEIGYGNGGKYLYNSIFRYLDENIKERLIQNLRFDL